MLMAKTHKSSRGTTRAVYAMLLCAFSASVLHAGSVKTRDGKSFEGEVRFNDHGAVVVQPTAGAPVTIEFTNLAHASFATGAFLSSGSILPNGWLAEDLGDARGFSRLDADSFTLRVEGQSTNALAGHFIHRPMPSDGEIVAHIDRIGGNGAAHAGIMIRGSRDSSVFASLACGNDGKLWFNRRPDPDRRETHMSSGWSASPPVWLRLRKREKLISAAFSKDGSLWQAIANDSIKLGPERTWRDYEGELWLAHAIVGVFASSRGPETIGTASVSQVSLSMRGLLGEYFGDQHFKKLRLARIDPQIKFNWNLDAPNPLLAPDDFSVRWTGQLIPPRTGQYRFFFDGDDRARLWINGKEMPTAGLKRPEKRLPATTAPPAITLIAGRLVDLKLEMTQGAGEASAKLGWTFQNHSPPEVITMTNLFYPFAATNSPERVMVSHPNRDMPKVSGVLLRDGSFIAGPVAFADVSAVRLSYGGRKDVPLLNSKVARIFIHPPRQPLRFAVAGGRTGLFLKTGDFFESDFHSIEHGALNMSSVLFGMKRYWMQSSDPVAVILNECAPSAGAFEVRLLDGSLFRALKLTATADGVTLEEPVLGRFFVPASDLLDIQSLAARAGTSEIKAALH